MQVFIGWSRSTSREVALALRDWLKKVVQAVDPWMSEQDIESGARWNEEIASALGDARFGIICLTPENKDTPWIHFEAGAISASITAPRVCPYLFRLNPSDVVPPLGQFQSRRADQEDTMKLLKTINTHLESEQRLSEHALNEIFEVWWPRLDGQLQRIVVREVVSRSRPVEEMVAETLELTRSWMRDQAIWLSFFETAIESAAKGKNAFETIRPEDQLLRVFRKFAEKQKSGVLPDGTMSKEQFGEFAERLLQGLHTVVEMSKLSPQQGEQAMSNFADLLKRTNNDAAECANPSQAKQS
jgi:hypothetical protein